MAEIFFMFLIKMIGVQSCKHFGCQRSHPMILGFGHPSGALEDGARGKILVFKQWKWTDYYIMWSLCIVESTVLARQTKKLSKFEVRDEFCQRYKMPGGTNFFRGTKFFYDWPYVGKISSEEWSPKKPKFDRVPGFSPQFRHRNPILHKKSHL